MLHITTSSTLDVWVKESVDDGEVVFKAGIKKFKVDPYYVIIDRLSSSLSKQIDASPLSALPAQRISSANETLSYDRASATCVCLTATEVLYTSLLFG